MPPFFSFNVTGHREAGRYVKGIAREWPKMAGHGQLEEGKIDLKEMVYRTPELTGDLRSTGKVEQDDDDLSITWSFGDSDVDYAIPVHEDLDAFHPVGQAKYMESVFNESSRTWGKRVAARAHLERLRVGVR